MITQNKENLQIFSKFYKEEKIIISKLPDFKNSGVKICTSNNKIVIGIIGAIGVEKGEKFLQLLINTFKNSNEIEIVLFGICNINLENHYYKDIHELNDLLIKFKPNILIETSLWPETYSYTLTLAMLTQLPILSIKKNYASVIENRLSKYEKTFYFSTLREMTHLIKNFKQDYFYTIDPVLYYNDFWENYFINDNINQDMKLNNVIHSFADKYVISNENENENEKNIVFISSKIYVSNKPFSYVDSRSIYSPKDRFEQTKNTIETIRKYIPDNYIILFDNSEFTQDELIELSKIVDLFLNIKNDTLINYYTNEHKTKAYGDLAQTLGTLRYLNEQMQHLKFKNFFKISGRYIINETFNYEKYATEQNIFKKNSHVLDRPYFYTSFYKISSRNFLNYCETINKIYNEIQIHNNYDNIDWEVILPAQLNYNFIDSNHLGITQNIAVFDQKDMI